MCSCFFVAPLWRSSVSLRACEGFVTLTQSIQAHTDIPQSL